MKQYVQNIATKHKTTVIAASATFLKLIFCILFTCVLITFLYAKILIFSHICKYMSNYLIKKIKKTI